LKKIIIVIVVLVVLAGGLIFAYREMSKEREMEMQGEAPVIPESRVKRSGGGIVVTLDAETQKRIELRTEVALATNLTHEVKGYGRVLDPAPLAAAVLEIAPAQSALETSRKELERVKTLRGQDNASARALEAAEFALRRDELALAAARTRLSLAWDKSVAEQNDLPAFLRSLVARETVLVRVELPAGESLNSPPSSARLVTLANPDEFIEAAFLGDGADVDLQTQGRAFLFLAKATSGKLAPGAMVTAFLLTGGAPVSGVVIPRNAVLRADGKAWIYVQTGVDGFVRREISLAHPLPAGWFVTRELTASEKLVVTGAQTLLSEELKARIPKMGD
jgi:hypothetical protein